MMLEGGRHLDATQVKGLSPEITIISEADNVHLVGKQNSHNRYKQGYASPTGSKTVSRCQRTDVNSGEPMYSQSECGIKPMDGKIQQGIIHWQSDYPIVSKKSRNWDGEKGIAIMRRDRRETSARHGAGGIR